MTLELYEFKTGQYKISIVLDDPIGGGTICPIYQEIPEKDYLNTRSVLFDKADNLIIESTFIGDNGTSNLGVKHTIKEKYIKR